MQVGDDPQHLESGKQAACLSIVSDQHRSCSTWKWIPLMPASFDADGVSRLPRKEVIQPHLPVRLPCYDFTPITDPTLDACLSEELARRLQVLPTFVV